MSNLIAAVITIAFLDAPENGRKTYNVKSKDNQRFGVFPEKVEEFGLKVGGTYAIEYSSRDYNGKTYHTIVKAKATNGSNGGNGSSSAPVAQSEPQNDRGARIERQHSQHMALRFLALRGPYKDGGLPSYEDVIKLADKFAADIENAGTVEVATVTGEESEVEAPVDI